MSTFNDFVTGGYEFAEGIAGQEVRIDTVTGALTGILDRSTHRQELADGGFAPEANATLTMAKAQLEAVWIPCLGAQLTTGGRRYKVVMVEEDAASWILGLMATSQQKRTG